MTPMRLVIGPLSNDLSRNGISPIYDWRRPFLPNVFRTENASGRDSCRDPAFKVRAGKYYVFETQHDNPPLAPDARPRNPFTFFLSVFLTNTS